MYRHNYRMPLQATAQWTFQIVISLDSRQKMTIKRWMQSELFLILKLNSLVMRWAVTVLEKNCEGNDLPGKNFLIEPFGQRQKWELCFKLFSEPPFQMRRNQFWQKILLARPWIQADECLSWLCRLRQAMVINAHVIHGSDPGAVPGDSTKTPVFAGNKGSK